MMSSNDGTLHVFMDISRIPEIYRHMDRDTLETLVTGGCFNYILIDTEHGQISSNNDVADPNEYSIPSLRQYYTIWAGTLSEKVQMSDVILYLFREFNYELLNYIEVLTKVSIDEWLTQTQPKKGR